MGTWGPGLWSDDTAADVRVRYREALEDGLGDDEAATLVLTEFAADLGDEDTAGVVWLALAVSQHLAGRLSADVRDQALAVIDTGADARRWEHAEPHMRARRAEVLAKVRDQLAGPQAARKRIRRPPRQVTSLTPGDILAYQVPSDRRHGSICWPSAPSPRTGTALSPSSACSTTTSRASRRPASWRGYKISEPGVAPIRCSRPIPGGPSPARS
jgi:hypothetical protein